MKRNKSSYTQKSDKSSFIDKTCRICLSNSSFRDICNNYFYCGKLENYGEMLHRTFNIRSLKSKKTLICDDCVTKLRDARDFKQKVLSSDEFLSGLADDAVETYDSDLELNSDIESNIDGKDWSLNQNPSNKIEQEKNTIFLKQVKTEIKQEPDNFELPSNENNDDNDNYYDDEFKTTPNDENNRNDNVVSKKVRSLKNVKKKKNRGSLKTSKRDCDKKPKKQKDTIEEKEPKIPETIKNIQENTHNLIINSNLCLFKSLKTKFACCDCKETFFEIKELRQHSTSHFDPSILKTRCKRMTGLSYKNADISNLKCKICFEICEDLECLKSHLESHGVKFFENGHFLIPFKLEEGLKCVLCKEQFKTFTRLAIHMNTHSSHNVCEICGNSYYNRLSLRTHIFGQHKDKKCSKCDMVFSKTNDRMKHLKKVHGIFNRKRYCLKCNTTFKYTHQLAKHKIEKHGAEKMTVFCQMCGKKFASPMNLNTHIRNVHLKERNYGCSVCDMRFFTTNDKKRHEKIHVDDRPYACSFCSTKFKSKDSVRRHLRRQHGHFLSTDGVKEKIS